MNNIELSIVIPVYNVEKYLLECIESIVNQRYKNYEIILVDDGSCDRCPKICDFYSKKYSNIKTVHIKNAGLGNARNIGIKESKGKYVSFVDADDFIKKESLLNIMNKIKKMNATDMFLMNGVKIYENYKQKSIDSQLSEYDFNKLNNKKLMINNICNMKKYPGSACTKIYRRDFLIENNLFFETKVLSEDLLFVFKTLILAKKICYINDVYYCYRQKRTGSITNSISQRNISGLQNFIINGIQTLNIYYNKTDSEYRNLLKFIAYEYIIIIMNYSKSTCDNRMYNKQFLTNYKQILKETKEKKHMCIYYFVNTFGYTFVSYLLRIYKIFI